STLGVIVSLASLYHLYLTHIVDRRPSKTKLVISINNDGNNNSEVDLNKSKPVEFAGKHAVDMAPILKQPNCPPKRTIPQQFVLAFSAVGNSEKLFRIDDRLAVLDTFRFVLTFAVYSLQTFHFQAMFTMQMLR